MTTDHRGRTYKYSAENQLYTVYEGAVLLAQNVYYGDGSRRYLNSASGGVRRFYYDGDQEIAEYDSADAALVRRYVRLPGSVDEPVLMIDYTVNAGCATAANGAGPCERWAHQNRLGSVVAVTSNTGAVVERHQYGPYGEIGGSASGFPFRFTGQKLDPETGLYYYKARFYDPEVGRFLQTDPIGYRDQMNLYAYVANDPVNGVDPNGEFIQAIIACGVNAACRAAVGGVIGAVVGGASNAYSELTDDEEGFNRGRFAAKTAIDTATGAAIGARPDKAGAIAAAGGVAKAIAADAITGNLDPVETAKHATAEGVSGLIGGVAGKVPGGLTGTTLLDDAAGAAAGAAASTLASPTVQRGVDAVTQGPPPARLPPETPPDIRSGIGDPCSRRESDGVLC